MSTQIAVRGDGLATPDAAISQLRAVRTQLATADFESVFAARIMAEVLNVAARAKRADGVAREAAETRARAERRLGELLLSDPSLAKGLDASVADVGNWKLVAEVPLSRWEKSLRTMLAAGKVCSPRRVAEHAERSSLSKVEPGLWSAYNGVYYTERYAGGGKHRAGRVTLDSVRESVRRGAGLSKSWRSSPNATRLDEAHARSRRLAQALSMLGQTLTGEARDLVGQAELRQAEVAEMLYSAYRLAAYDELNVAA